MKDLKKSKQMAGIGNHQYMHGLEKFRTYKWLYQKYYTEEMSLSQIANQIGISIGCLVQWMDAARIQRRLAKPRKGIHHWRFIGHHINSQGYRMILDHDHPNSNKQGYIREHIVVAEKHIGRILGVKETVHHLNSKRTDNRPENLYIFSTNNEHDQYHQLERRNSKLFKKITKSNLSMYA